MPRSFANVMGDSTYFGVALIKWPLMWEGRGFCTPVLTSMTLMRFHQNNIVSGVHEEGRKAFIETKSCRLEISACHLVLFWFEKHKDNLILINGIP